MKLTRDEYILENIKLSMKNTTIILNSVEKNLNDIKNITRQIQTSDNHQETMVCFTRIREIAIESVIEKCNMFKAGVDRFVIPFEDVIIPKMVKYIKIRNPRGMTPLSMNANKRFRDKISRNNIPAMLSPIIIEDDGSDGYYE